MKKISNIVFFLVIAFVTYQNFFYNLAEADAKISYQKMLDGKALLIDVREESEIKAGMIKGAQWIALSQIEHDRKVQMDKIKSLTKDKEVYLYCRSGARANKVKTYLEDVGINAVNLGGYPQLTEAGLPSNN
jgi:rhodanese-related sulfurtransferase